MKKSFFTVYFLFLLFTVSFAQPYEQGIKIIHKVKDGRVLLRWAPISPIIWQAGNQYGYTIERKEIMDNGALQIGNFVPHTAKVYTLKAMEKLSQQDDKVKVVAQILYGSPYKAPDAKASFKDIVKKKKELENHFAMSLFVCDLSLLAAQSAGLFWTDSTAQQGKRYAYQIRLTQNPTNIPHSPAVEYVEVKESPKLVAPTELSAEFRDKQVMLSWNTFLHHGLYSSYYIERSEDGKNFKQLNDIPYVYMVDKKKTDVFYYRDSLATNNKTYYYRIKGISPFTEISPPSNIVQGEGIENLNGQLIIDSAKVIKNEKVELKWSVEESLVKKAKGYLVKRALKPDGVMETLTPTPLSPQTFSFIDNKPGRDNYYEIHIVDKRGNTAGKSFPYYAMLEDNDPPIPPQNITGKIDSVGIVTLSWQDNKEEDMLGYRIFRANNPNEEFMEITKKLMPKPSYTDTISIKTLTKNVYYQIVAVDRNYNNSEVSAILTLKRPDKIPPSPPIITDWFIKNDSITLKWQNTTSDDVAKSILKRKSKEDSTWIVLKEWTLKEDFNGIIETKKQLTNGQYYSYQIVAIDSSNNQSKAEVPFFRYENGKRSPVKIVSEVNREKNFIKLKWETTEKNIIKTIIYRAINEEPLTLYESIPGNPTFFEEKKLSIGNKYRYAVQLVLPKGIRTETSKIIELKY